MLGKKRSSFERPVKRVSEAKMGWGGVLITGKKIINVKTKQKKWGLGGHCK